MGTKNKSRTNNTGHDRRNEIIFCSCGCRKKFKKFKYYFAPSLKKIVRRERKFILGHNALKDVPRTNGN